MHMDASQTKTTHRRTPSEKHRRKRLEIVDGCTIRPSIVPHILGTVPLAVFWVVSFFVDKQVRIAFFLIAALWTLYRFVKVVFSVYAVKFIMQKNMIIKQVGIISRTTIQARTSDIRNITTVQDMFGRLLGYGDINIYTAATDGAEIVMRGVPDPVEIVAALDARRCMA